MRKYIDEEHKLEVWELEINDIELVEGFNEFNEAYEFYDIKSELKEHIFFLRGKTVIYKNNKKDHINYIPILLFDKLTEKIKFEIEYNPEYRNGDELREYIEYTYEDWLKEVKFNHFYDKLFNLNSGLRVGIYKNGKKNASTNIFGEESMYFIDRLSLEELSKIRLKQRELFDEYVEWQYHSMQAHFIIDYQKSINKNILPEQYLYVIKPIFESISEPYKFEKINLNEFVHDYIIIPFIGKIRYCHVIEIWKFYNKNRHQDKLNLDYLGPVKFRSRGLKMPSEIDHVSMKALVQFYEWMKNGDYREKLKIDLNPWEDLADFCNKTKYTEDATAEQWKHFFSDEKTDYKLKIHWINKHRGKPNRIPLYRIIACVDENLLLGRNELFEKIISHIVYGEGESQDNRQRLSSSFANWFNNEFRRNKEEIEKIKEQVPSLTSLSIKPN